MKILAAAAYYHMVETGIGVLVEATHTCMTLRGARATGSKTSTSAVRGILREDARSRAEFFALAADRTR